MVNTAVLSASDILNAGGALAGYSCLEELLNREGEATTSSGYFSMGLSGFSGWSGAGQPIGIGFAVPSVGRSFFLKEIGFSASKDIAGRLQIGATGSAWAGSGTYPAVDTFFGCGPGSPARLEPELFIRSCDRISLGARITSILDMKAADSLGTVTADTTSGDPVLRNMTIRPPLGFSVVGAGIPAGATIISYGSNGQATMSANATATAAAVSLAVHGLAVSTTVMGYQLADSINFDADKVILCIGDSTWNGSGPTDVTKCVPFQINKFYQDQGINSRYILKAQSGTTTSWHYWQIANGKYNFPRLDAIFVNLGLNDVGQGYTTDGVAPGAGASMPNIRAIIAWKQKLYPSAKLVFFGTTPMQNTTNENSLQMLRDAISAQVSLTNDPSIIYENLGVAFDRTDGTNYLTSDGTDGTRIHPTDKGLTSLLDGGYNGYTGLRARLLSRIPAI